MQKNFTSTINYASIFDDLALITGLPLVRRGRKWEGACYVDGQPHKRRDKTTCFVKREKIMMVEQGGWYGDIWQWLCDYKGMSDLEIGNFLRKETGCLPSVEFDIPETKFVEPRMLNSTLGFHTDALYSYLSSVFGEEKVKEAYYKYFVGSREEGTCFWFISQDGKICRDKTMFYKDDGHRDKDRHPRSKFPSGMGYDKKCFFGEHLLNGYDGPVYLVESEKTALLFYLKWGKICLATGGSNCIKGIKEGWTLLPDFDKAGEKWFEIKGVRVVEWWKSFGYQPEEGEDIGDYIIKNV